MAVGALQASCWVSAAKALNSITRLQPSCPDDIICSPQRLGDAEQNPNNSARMIARVHTQQNNKVSI